MRLAACDPVVQLFASGHLRPQAMNRTGGENVVRQKLGILSCTILAATMHYVDMLPIVVIFRLVEVDSDNDIVD